MKSEIRNLKSEIGFTLVELLVVITIIALLLGILIVGVVKGRAAAEKAATEQYMGAISLAVQTYQNDFNAYPPSHYQTNPFEFASSTPTDSNYATFGVPSKSVIFNEKWEGSELLAQALVGFYTDDNHSSAGWAQSANSKVYGPYLDTGEYGILKSTIHTTAYILADTWDQPIQYYRANYGATDNDLWAAGASHRFDTDDNSSSPHAGQNPADDSILRSAKYLLISIGGDGKVSGGTSSTEKAKDADNVVVTGP